MNLGANRTMKLFQLCMIHLKHIESTSKSVILSVTSPPSSYADSDY